MDIMLSPFTACSCCTLSNAEAFLMPSLCIPGKLATLEYSGWHLLFNSGMVYYQFLLISKLVPQLQMQLTLCIELWCLILQRCLSYLCC